MGSLTKLTICIEQCREAFPTHIVCVKLPGSEIYSWQIAGLILYCHFRLGGPLRPLTHPKKKGWCPSVGWHNLVHWKQLKPIALNTARPRPPQKTDSAPAMSLSVTSPGSPCAWPWTPWRPSPAWRRLWERHRGPRHRQGPQIQMNGIMPRQLVWLPSGS